MSASSYPMTDDHADLPARVAAAAALSRLGHALVRHRADPAVLERLAEAAERLAGDIENEPRRERRMELLSHPGFETAAQRGSLADLMADGAFVDAFEDSPISGSANPLSMGLRVGRDGDEAVGQIVVQHGWQGAPGRAHGGVVAAVIDEVYGALLPIIGCMAFTGELSVRYVAPCPIERPLEFRARLLDRQGRKLYVECEGRADGELFATSTATFIEIELDQFRR